MAKKKTNVDIGSLASEAVSKQFENLLQKIQNGTISAPEMELFSKLEKRLKSEQGQEEGVIYDRSLISKHFKRSDRTILNWIKDGMPVRPDGGFCLSDIHEWLNSKKQEKKSKKDDSEQYWRKEYKKNKAKLSELELKLKRGDLLPKADVIAALKEIQSYVKKHVALIPRTAPGKLTGLGPQNMQAVLSEITSGILINMSKGQNAGTLEAKLK